MSDAFLIGSILDTSANYICVLDSKGTVLTASEGFSRIVNGRGRETLTGLNLSSAVLDSTELKEFFSSILAKTDGSYLHTVHRNGQNPVSIQF